MKIIEIHNLLYEIGSFKLKIEKFEVEKGEFLAIIGPNGSGKTTFLKILSGLIRNFKGDIKINGKDIKKMKYKELAKVIGVVPQEFFSSFYFSVKSVVETARLPYVSLFGNLTKKDKKIVNNALKYTHLLDFENRNFPTLSGGEKQRTMIARLIAQTPSIYLLDEFVSFLDPGFTYNLLKLIFSHAKKERKTVISIFHDINLASLYSDRIAIMKNGEFKIIDTPNKVITSENIKKYFSIDCIVINHPSKNRPMVLFDL